MMELEALPDPDNTSRDRRDVLCVARRGHRCPPTTDPPRKRASSGVLDRDASGSDAQTVPPVFGPMGLTPWSLPSKQAGGRPRSMAGIDAEEVGLVWLRD